MEATCDLDGETNVDELFKLVDANGDGELTLGEFTTFLNTMVNVYPGGKEPAFAEADVRPAFEFIDTSNNGLLEPEEFRHFFMGEPLKVAGPEEQNVWFFDADLTPKKGDGCLKGCWRDQHKLVTVFSILFFYTLVATYGDCRRCRNKDYVRDLPVKRFRR